MPKMKKTERELREMISAATGIPATHIKISGDETYGWVPTVYVAARDAQYAQQAAEEAARELRERFDLEE